jgi:transcriptional regulator with GAF, ATPase, and Fis domain
MVNGATPIQQSWNRNCIYKLYSFIFNTSFNTIDSSNRIGRMEIKTLQDKERELLREVLTKTDWNLQKASRLLQIPLSQVKKKIRHHGLKKPNGSA